MYMDKRFALRLKLHKVDGTIVHHNALLRRIIPKGQLVQGYSLCDNEACWHCWVVDAQGEIFDVGKQLGIQYTYSDHVPEGYKEMEHEMIEKNKKLYQLYIDDPIKFWKQAPTKVKNFSALK
jgi:hypothetical protein